MQRNREQAIRAFHNQDFYSTRDWCLKRGYLFEDPYFNLDYDYEWKRPPQITSNPQLFVGGPARFDIRQGELGDCWMLASIASIGMYPDLVRKVVPSDQSFTSQYAGIFHFRFWRFGKWYDVVIDDRLPTRHGRLVFTQSVSQNEFWTALVEKAYCKAIGGEYKAADAGNLCEALEDFTGGIVEQYHLESVPRTFQNVLLKSVGRRSLVGCFIDDIPGSSESQTPEGLVRGHSYSVTGVKNVDIPEYGNIVLVRVRNPWGKYEWKGPWSDHSPEWEAVSENTKQQLGLVLKDEGEFWMSYSDFVSNFQWVDMCHLSPDSCTDEDGNTASISTWELNSIRGSWVRGVTAGGVYNLYRNPQIRFTLSEADDGNNDGVCSVVLALMQRCASIDDYTDIGFEVFPVSNLTDETLDRSFFEYTEPVADVPAKRVREVAGRFELSPGDYCVVPFTYDTGVEGEFLLRIYSEKRATMRQMDYRIGFSPVDATAVKEPPMKIASKSTEDEKSERGIKEYFDKVAGADKEVDWKELKNVLDFAIKKNISPSDDKDDGAGSFLVNNFVVGTASAVYNKIFGSSQKNNAFKTIGPEGFSNDVCRSMVALVDVDHSGKLGFSEFNDLWAEIKNFKAIYESHSEKNDGYLSASGLKEALEAAGFKFNIQILSDIVHRYSTKDGKISFDDFLHCSIKIKSMMEFFRSKDKNDSHTAEFTLEEFMDKALYS